MNEIIYKDFYSDDVYFTNLNLLYLNRNNEIIKIKEDKFILQSPNIVSKEDIKSILKKNYIVDNKTYYLQTIIKINIDLTPQEVENFLKENTNQFSELYIKENDDIDDIVFQKTICMFQDLNDIFFILKEKVETKNNKQTKKNRNSILHLGGASA